MKIVLISMCGLDGNRQYLNTLYDYLIVWAIVHKVFYYFEESKMQNGVKLLDVVRDKIRIKILESYGVVYKPNIVFVVESRLELH